MPRQQRHVINSGTDVSLLRLYEVTTTMCFNEEISYCDVILLYNSLYTERKFTSAERNFSSNNIRLLMKIK